MTKRQDAFLVGTGVEPETFCCAECGYQSANRKNFRRSEDGEARTCTTGHYEKNGELKRQKNAYAEAPLMADTSGPYDPSGALTHLVTHFQSRSITADHLERMHPSVRDHYVKMAGLNSMTMSEQGWSAVIDHMRRRGSSSHA